MRRSTAKRRAQERRAKVAAAIFVLALAAITLTLLMFAVACLRGTIDVLHGTGWLFAQLFKGDGAVSVFGGATLVSIYAILGLGKSVVADNERSPALFYGSCIVAATGLLALFAIALSLHDGDAADVFWIDFCDPSDSCAADYLSNMTATLTGIGAWIVGCLATLLGLSSATDSTAGEVSPETAPDSAAEKV